MSDREVVDSKSNLGLENNYHISKISDALDFPNFSLTSFPNNFNDQDMEDVQLNESRKNSPSVDVEDRPKSNTEITSETFPTCEEKRAEHLNEVSRENSPITITISKPSDEEVSTRTNSVDENFSAQLKHTTVIYSTEETTEDTFRRLKNGFLNNSLSQRDMIESLFNVLVGGPFDLESRFIIEFSENINMMLEFIDDCPQNMQAEIWSIFVAIVRKSFRNLEACSRVGLISKSLDRLLNANPITSDFLIQLLCVLTNYSITVKETKRVLRALEARNGIWKRNSAKLLSVMQEMPKREGADVFFSFPGKPSAGIALPPLNKWPYQNGWTFSTWFRMDPLNSVNFEKEKPYLFNFATVKGLGYFCYFMGSCLVLQCVKASNKEVMKCIKHELTPRKWHHVAISYIYSRWAKSEIHCFIDGQLVEVVDSSWLVSTNEHFDRCFIGCGSESDANEAFCGQIAAVYVFSQSISVQQVTCLYRLGASYQSHFKHDAESNLPDGYKKHLFDGRLNSWLVFAYCPKNYHGQLCLFSPSLRNQTSYFVQVPHAIMKNGVEVVTTHSIHNSLHSVGGIQMLLPLFAQIDMPHECGDDRIVDYEICSKLLSVISLLLNTSASAQQQLFHSQGFLTIAHVLNTSAKEHLTLDVLELFISIAKFLQNCVLGFPLLKQLFDCVFFTPQLWIRTNATIQIRLYKFLANDFFSNPNFVSVIRYTPTVIGLMHTLKVYYYIVPPRNGSYNVCKFENAIRLNRSSIVHIRGYILKLVNKLMFSQPSINNGVVVDEKEWDRDQEFQCIFNFISTVTEDDNLYDVLNQTMRQMSEHPAVIVPAFDRKSGLCVIFKLIQAENELIKISALKTFAYFLSRSTIKRKSESINNLNLLHLLTDNVLANTTHLTLATYNALFEILTEQICPEILFLKHEDFPVETTHFENPPMLKVIASIIIQSKDCAELLMVRKIFLLDLVRLCKDSRENRRTILQMSVWQEWLISLAYIFPENSGEEEVTNLVYTLLSILLFHAIRLEYGGWRVWVDTLSIAHSKVSLQQYHHKLINERVIHSRCSVAKKNENQSDFLKTAEVEKNNKLEPINENEIDTDFVANDSVKEQPSSLYRTPDFVWSDMHVRLLEDLLTLIEEVVEEWNSFSSLIALVDHVNNSDNQIFISNTVHVLSQLIDSLIMACGGLLPLLAAATAPNSELDIVDSTQQNLDVITAVSFLQRFVELADVFIFASGINFSELEQEKNMPNGGILRQSLRLVSTMAVRNILACRIAQQDRGFCEVSMNSKAKHEAILKFVNKAIFDKSENTGISNVDSLLQNVDLKRLKGIIYRDMEEGRHAQFLSLSVVYLLSVLMVSRYRDILEPPTSPSPFFDTNSDSSARKKSVESSFLHKSKSSNFVLSSIVDENSSQESSHSVQANETPSVDLSSNDHPAELKPSKHENEENDDENDKQVELKVEKKEESESESEENKNDSSDENNRKKDQAQRTRVISSIQVEHTNSENNDDSRSVKSNTNVDSLNGNEEKYDTNQLSRFNAPNIKILDTSKRRQYLTVKLQKALESVAPLLREIMTDFRSFLQKTLLGTHGQEIMNDAKVMHSLKSHHCSVIELVMLLCSQEWQTSLQKHAGLAFIELVNEGRLMAHATRDHILRVANEADFILKRLRAEDVSKHAEFEKEAMVQSIGRKRDEQVSDHLRDSTKRRDFLIAVKLLEKMRTILLSPSGAWSDIDENPQTFLRLDLWEDDSRRRKRFMPNVYGCRHSVMSLQHETNTANVENFIKDDLGGKDAEKMHEQLLKDLARKMNLYSAKREQNSTMKELVDEADIEKWSAEESSNETRSNNKELPSYSVKGKLIAPGIVVPGTFSITSTDVYFDADEEDPLYKEQDIQSLRFCDNLHGRWHFQEIRAIFLRRYALQYVALEFFLASRTAIMFAFEDQATVKNVVDYLPTVGVGIKYGLPQNRKASLMSPKQIFKHSDMSQKWQRREISNFDYLMFLNTIAGRTYNDFNQYPVFPWILSNYTSEKLDLSEASNFRDLSKPIGALSESRKKYFQEKFNSWNDESIPAFHYGTHYSTQAFTLNWLFRMEPFMSYFLSLQSGKCDHSDRLFHSLAETWEHCQRDTHDVKELIPELFYLPEMFVNSNNYDLGQRQKDGVQVNDVILPPWAKSAEHFILMHRQALESDMVSCQLNQWIDLIFGYKQRGPEAVRATNVFYYLTYEGCVDLNSLNDTIHNAIQNQILNFGQTPVQLMTEPHPPRHSIMTMSPLMFQPCNNDLCMLMKFISNSAVVHITANTFLQLTNPTVLSISQNLIFALNRWNSNFNQSQGQSSGVLRSAISANTCGAGDAAGSNSTNFTASSDLPLTVDPLLAIGNPSQPPAKRHLGDAFDQRLNISWSNFVCTTDSKFIFACGYPDYSFRLIETESATVCQVIYGHGDVVTCLARSEAGLFSDCYIASGSLDCTVVLWHFSHLNQLVAGEYNVVGEAPSPRAILTGHDSEITAIFVSAEHGVVISGSKDGTVLMHTTQGDLIRHIVLKSSNSEANIDAGLSAVTNILLSRDCYLAVFYGNEYLAVFTASSGRQLNYPTHRFTEKVLSAVLSRDGDYIVLGTANGKISVLRLFPLQLLYTFPQTDSATKCVAVSTNQKLIFGGLDSGAIVVFNVDFNKWHYEYKQRYSYR